MTDAGLAATVREHLQRAGREPLALHDALALRPASATPLPNPVGTAPGLLARLGPATLACFPGVPAELHAMVRASLLPALQGAGLAREAPSGLLRTVGVAESALAEHLEPLASSHGLALGWYPHQGEVDVRLYGTLDAQAAFLERAKAALGLALFSAGTGADAPARHHATYGLAHATLDALRERGLTLVTAESMTAGQVAAALADVPGASAVLRGGWVTYAAAMKTVQLGVSTALIEREGVVSEAVAHAMASAALARSDADLALSLTGVAGPGAWKEPPHEIAAGTVHIALCGRDGRVAHTRLARPGPRPVIRRRATVAALDLVRRHALRG